MLGRWQLGLLCAATVSIALAVLSGCAQSSVKTDSQPGAVKSITIYCGGGVRGPVAQCVGDFVQQTSSKVDVTYGPSPRMFEQACKDQGDIYLAGDIHFIQLAQNRGEVLARQTVCYVVPVIVVPRGNPKRIAHVADLGQPGIRFYLVDPKQCQQGFLGERLLAEQGVGKQTVLANRVSKLPKGRDVAAALAAGDLDAAIVWERGAKSEKIEIVGSSELEGAACPVAGIVMRWCRDQPTAERLLAYLAGPGGQRVFREHGFRLDPPTTRPEPSERSVNE